MTGTALNVFDLFLCGPPFICCPCRDLEESALERMQASIDFTVKWVDCENEGS